MIDPAACYCTLMALKLWWINLPTVPNRLALWWLGRALRRDPSYLESWHATLTMTIVDHTEANHARAWRASAAFLKAIFGVTVPKHPDV